ncbi:hypothetical protein MCP_2378 [Methanocella paludicola SANAE]|uniref:Uncharacterized protein n=1 Tax=Methanocella paludicola (strain DSM 17711 / JCM 13418 / NBRC 101707 / SANAE) TaxID=304371 RepID=D1Z178_METPS|nr:hypothetical protein [Methanocella paludicola]BAI62450.1 hypothetical protein MCP_2378 [Methanocella paludicola SANAE]
MKNETKILVGAIIVILLLLVGAYALSGSSPQPSATPTVLPVTVTPTVTPVPSVSVTPSVEPTVTATATATPVPSVTPTPTPESGVKQTEFGYWITYPPLGPQNWSEYKSLPSDSSQDNIVFFNPTSAVYPINIQPAAMRKDGDTAVYRQGGDINQTVVVKIHASMSDNVGFQTNLNSIPEYTFSMYTLDTENMTGPDENGDYLLTLGPGVSHQDLFLHIYHQYWYDSVDAMPYMPTPGWVKLTITDVVEGNYGIGSQKEFNLSLEALPEIWFGNSTTIASDGYLNREESGIDFSGDIDHIAENDSYVDVFIPIIRETDKGTLTPYLYWNGGISDVMVTSPSFIAGQKDGLVKVSIPSEYVTGGDNYQLTIYIGYNEGYIPGWPSAYGLHINYSEAN